MSCRRPLMLGTTALLLAGGVLAGCSAAEDVASQAGDAASQAARDAALQQARDQICPLVQDRQLSDQDLETLRAAVEVAKAAGAESEFLTTVEEVAGAAGDASGSAVTRLTAECDTA